MNVHGESLAGPIGNDYYELHRSQIAELFDILHKDMPGPDEIVEATQPWAKGDHFSPKNRVELDADQETAARVVFDKLGLVAARPAVGGEYGQIIILGGTMRANDIRTGFLRDQMQRQDNPVKLAPGSKMMFWAGPRDRDDDLELPYIRNSLRAVVTSTDPWLQMQRNQAEANRITDETAESRLAILQHFGSYAMRRADLRLYASDYAGSYGPVIRDYTLLQGSQGSLRSQVPQTESDIILMNAAPVARNGVEGDPRHTTASCAAEWLAGGHAPQAEDERVLLVSSNPYIDRTTLAVQEVVEQFGSSIQLEGCGPAAYNDARIHLFFGEFARQVYMADAASRS